MFHVAKNLRHATTRHFPNPRDAARQAEQGAAAGLLKGLRLATLRGMTLRRVADRSMRSAAETEPRNVKNLWNDRLVRGWIVALTGLFTVSVLLLVFGLYRICGSGRSTGISDLFVCVMGGLILGRSVWHWVRPLRGKVLLSTHQTLALNGGELTIPQPACPYELWIFCERPFARYHGQITVTHNGTGSTHTITIPDRNRLLYKGRSDRTPIVWRAPSDEFEAQGQCCIAFHLSPTFAETVFDNFSGSGNDEKSVTVMVKTA
jgi:hypothetical protein